MQKRVFINDQATLSLRFLYRTKIGRLVLKILILPIISKIIGKFMDTKLSTIFIKPFIRKYQINLTDYINQNYQSFNDFFTRRLKNINFSNNKNHLIAPADSKLSAYHISKNLTFKVKNTIYNLSLLLNDPKLAKEYENGWCLIYRLDVSDYHHYLYIDDGLIKQSIEIPGVLHTVKPIGITNALVFHANHRVINLLNTKNFDQVIQIEVGALMVGTIDNYHQLTKFNKGESKGAFRFGGSTIIQLFKENTITINQNIISNTNYNYETIVKIGETVGIKNN